MSEAALASFVQFPHPGGEHRPPPTDHMPWNTADHRRKYLLADGAYLDADHGTVKTGQLVFWGEWEPPSTVVQRWPPSDGLPRALHQPYWTRPMSDGYRQNTDPWVWGDRMIYSNCKQTTHHGTRPTAMQRLTRGSVICFGSASHGEFCVDTVLVVADVTPWEPPDVAGLPVGDAFRVCTAESIASGADTGQGTVSTRLALVRGATIDDPVEGMFSFVPALPVEGDYPRFDRPGINVPGLINPKSLQAPRGTAHPLTLESVRSGWDAVVQQTLAKELVLAVHLDTPGERSARSADSPTPTHGHC